jgi:tight adherence protein B
MNQSKVSNNDIDYSNYVFVKNEIIIYCLAAATFIFCLSYVFYRNYFLSLLLCFFSPLYLKIRKRELILKRKNEITLQFREFLSSLSSSLNAGKSIENSLFEAYKDLQIIYPDKNTNIRIEVHKMIIKIRMNYDFSEVFSSFSVRSGVDDIQSFSEVISICRKSGGNIIEVIKNSANIINDKLEIQNDIDVLLSKCKFEAKILNIVPPALVLMLSITSWDYMEPVFTTLYGRLAVTAAIFLLMGAYFVSRKISDIKI